MSKIEGGPTIVKDIANRGISTLYMAKRPQATEPIQNPHTVPHAVMNPNVMPHFVPVKIHIPSHLQNIVASTTESTQQKTKKLLAKRAYGSTSFGYTKYKRT